MRRRIFVIIIVLATALINSLAFGCSSKQNTNDMKPSTTVIDGQEIENNLLSDPIPVPAKAITEYFGAQVSWKEETSTLEITSPHQKYLREFGEGVYSIQADDALTLINERKAVVLDIRSDELRNRGRVVDSLHIPVAELLDRMKELPGGKAIVVYCRDNISATYAVFLLNIRGYEAYVLVGGMNAWITAGGKTIFCTS